MPNFASRLENKFASSLHAAKTWVINRNPKITSRGLIILATATTALAAIAAIVLYYSPKKFRAVPKAPQPSFPAPTNNPVTAKPLLPRNPTPVSSPVKSPTLKPCSNLSSEPSQLSFNPPAGAPPAAPNTVDPNRLLTLLDNPQQSVKTLYDWLRSQPISDQLKLLMHVHMDMHGQDSEFQGMSQKTATTYFCHLLTYCLGKNHPLMSEFTQLNALTLGHYTPAAQALEIGRSIRKLEPGQWFHFSGGWLTKINFDNRVDPGHAIIYSFEKTPSGRYNFYVIDTGTGAEYQVPATSPTHQKSCPAVVWQDLTEDQLFLGTDESICHEFFQVLVEYDNKALAFDAPRHTFLYEELIGRYLNQTCLPIQTENLFMRLQQSGICAWRSLMALLLIRLGNKEEYKKASYLVSAVSLLALQQVLTPQLYHSYTEAQQIRTCLKMTAEQFLVRQAKYFDPTKEQNLISYQTWHAMGDFAQQLLDRVNSSLEAFAQQNRKTSSPPVPSRPSYSPHPLPLEQFLISSRQNVDLTQSLPLSAPNFECPQEFHTQLDLHFNHIQSLYETDPLAAGKMAQDIALALPLPQEAFWNQVPQPGSVVAKLNQLFEATFFLCKFHWNTYSLEATIGLSYMGAIHQLALLADREYRSRNPLCVTPDLGDYGVWFDPHDSDDYFIAPSQKIFKRKEALISYFRIHNQNKPDILFNDIPRRIDQNYFEKCFCDANYYHFIIKNNSRYKEIEKGGHLTSIEALMKYINENNPLNEIIYDAMRAFGESTAENWADNVFRYSHYQTLIYFDSSCKSLEIFSKDGTKTSTPLIDNATPLLTLNEIKNQGKGPVILVIPNRRSRSNPQPFEPPPSPSCFWVGQALNDFCRGTHSSSAHLTPIQKMTIRWVLDLGGEDSLLAADQITHLIALKRTQYLLQYINHSHPFDVNEKTPRTPLPPWKNPSFQLTQDKDIFSTGSTLYLSLHFCNIKLRNLESHHHHKSPLSRSALLDRGAKYILDESKQVFSRKQPALVSPQQIACSLDGYNASAAPYRYFQSTLSTRPHDILAYFLDNLHQLKATFKPRERLITGVDFLALFLRRGIVIHLFANTRLQEQVPLFEEADTNTFTTQFEKLLQEAFKIYFYDSALDNEDLIVCLGLIRLIQNLKNILTTHHHQYARLLTLEARYLQEVQNNPRLTPHQAAASHILHMLAYENEVAFNPEQIEQLYQDWIYYQLNYDQQHPLLAPEIIEASFTLLYKAAPFATEVPLQKVCEQALKLLGISLSSSDWQGQFPCYTTSTQQGTSYTVNLLQGRIASHDGQLALANQTPPWKTAPLSQLLFQNRTHTYVSEGTILTFNDPVWGNCRVFPPEPNQSSSNLDRRLQVQFDGSWHQRIDPLSNTPLILNAGHLHWLSSHQPAQAHVLITDTKGKKVAIQHENGQIIPYGSDNRTLSTATKAEANFYAAFEQPKYILIEKSAQGQPLITKLILTRFKTDRDNPLTFERVMKAKTGESRLVWTEQRHKALSSDKPLGLLGTFDAYIALETTTGKRSLLVPILPLSPMRDFATHAEMHAPEETPIENSQRSNLGSDNYHSLQQFSFLELDVNKQGKVSASHPEGHLFLAYLALSQKEYDRAITHLKAWQQWPVRSGKAQKILQWIGSSQLTHDMSAKAQTVRAYLSQTYDATKRHYLPWPMRTRAVELTSNIIHRTIPTASALPLPSGTLSFKITAERSRYSNSQDFLLSHIHRSMNLPDILSSEIKNSFINYYQLALRQDPIDRRRFQLRMRYLLSDSMTARYFSNQDLLRLLLFAHHYPEEAPADLKDDQSCDALITAYRRMPKQQHAPAPLNRAQIAARISLQVTAPIPLLPPLQPGPLKIEQSSTLLPPQVHPTPCQKIAQTCFKVHTTYDADEIAAMEIQNPFNNPPQLPEEEKEYQEAVAKIFEKYAHSLEIGTRINRALLKQITPIIAIEKIQERIRTLNSMLTSHTQQLRLSLESLINKRSSDEEIRYREQLLEKCGQLPRLTFEDILPWILRGKNTLRELQRVNPYLDSQDCEAIWTQSQAFLIEATHLQQVERSAILAEKILSAKHAEAKQSALKKLYLELNKPREYQPDQAPLLLVFEYVSNLLLRQSQYISSKELFEKDSNGNFRNIVRQIIMGDGKTTVASRLLSLFRCRPGRMSLLIPFTPQFSSLVQDFGFGMKTKFGQAIQPIDTPYNQLNTRTLQRILEQLQQSTENGELVMMKKETILFLVLRTLQPLCQQRQASPEQLNEENVRSFNLCCDILDLWSEAADAIGDEAHDLLDVSKLVNVSQGESRDLSTEDIALGHKIFSTLIPLLDQPFTVDDSSLTGREIVNMTLDQQGKQINQEGKQVAEPVNLKAYHTCLVPLLADALISWDFLELPQEYKHACKRYLTNQMTLKNLTAQDHAFLQYHETLSKQPTNSIQAKRANTLALARDLLQTILPFTLGGKFNGTYGRVDAQVMALHQCADSLICPYTDSQPATTKFGNEIEEMCYYYQAAIIQNVTYAEFVDWVTTIAAQARMSEQELGIPVSYTPEAYALQDIAGISPHEITNETTLRTAHQKLRNDPLKRLEIEKLNIKKNIHIHPEYLSANPHTLVKTPLSLQAFSGTTGNPEEYHHTMLVQETEGTEGRVVDNFLNKPSKNLKVSTQDAQTFIHQLLNQLTPQEQSHIHAIIDAGAFFRGKPNRLIATQLLQQLDACPQTNHIQGILYFDFPPIQLQNKHENADSLYFLKKGDPNPLFVGKTDYETIETLGIPLKHLCTFYDTRHITSTDLPLDPNAIALMTWSQRQTLVKNQQAAIRAREYLEGNQKIYFVGIGTAPVPGLRECNAAKEEALEYSQKALQSYFMQIETAAWTCAMRAIRAARLAAGKGHPGFLAAFNIFQATEKILLVQNNLSHYQRCGRLTTQEPPTDLMTQTAGRIRDTLENAKLDTTQFDAEVATILEKASSSRMLPLTIDSQSNRLSLGKEQTLSLSTISQSEEEEDKIPLIDQHGQVREVEAMVQQENQVQREEQVEMDQELRLELDRIVNTSPGNNIPYPLASWTEDDIIDFVNQLCNTDEPITSLITPTPILGMETILQPPSAHNTPQQLREEFASLFQDTPLYMTENQRHTYHESNLTIFHRTQKPTWHLLIVKRPQSPVGIMLAMGEAETEAFHATFKRGFRPKEAWLMHINGSVLVDMPEPNKSDLSTEDLTTIDELLWKVNFYEFRVNYLIKHMPTGKKYWNSLDQGLKDKALRFLNLKTCGTPLQWEGKFAFIQRLIQSSESQTIQPLMTCSTYSMEFANAQKTGLKHYSPQQFFTLPLYLVAAVQPEDIHKLNPDKHYPLLRNKQVAAIAPEHVRFIEESAYKSLITPEQIAQVPNESLIKLLEIQIPLLSESRLKLLKLPTHIRAIPTEKLVMQNLQKAQIKHLVSSQIFAIRDPALIELLSPEQLKDLHPDQVQQLPDNQIQHLQTPLQIEALSDHKLYLLRHPVAIPHVSPQRLPLLHPAAIPFLRGPAQINQLVATGSPEQILALKPMQIRSINEQQIPRLIQVSDPHIRYINPNFAHLVPPEKMQLISPHAVQFLENTKLKYLKPHHICGIQKHQVQYLTESQLVDLGTEEQVDGLTEAQIAQINSNPKFKFDNWPKECLERLSKRQNQTTL